MNITTNELAKLLQVKETGLKTIKRRNQLESRLKEKGYILVKEIKEGRNKLYELDKIEGFKVDEVGEFTKKHYNTKSKYFPGYYRITTENTDKEYPKTTEMRAKESKIYPSLVKKWDKKLESKDILIDNGYKYFLINIDYKDNLKKINQEEYEIIVSNRESLRGMMYTAFQFEKGNIKEEYFYDKLKNCRNAILNLSIVINKHFSNPKNKIYLTSTKYNNEFIKALRKACTYSAFRVRNYHLNKENELHKESIKMYSNIE